MSEYAGRGDPKRTLELLWGVGEPPSRGPKGRLNVAAIVRAAIELADANGLAALSMRKVAEKLGASAMSLYTYVPGKAELLDLMVDAVQVEAVEPEEATGDWRSRLTGFARRDWHLHRGHPWLLQVATSRPVLGPNLTRKYDRGLRTIEGIGLTDLQMDAVFTLVESFVRGAAQFAVDAAQAEQSTGKTDLEWWEEFGPLLAKVSDGDRYPIASRVGQAAGEVYQAAHSPEHTFEFGLVRILDGVELLIRKPAAPAGP
ncbi:TetR family transcriptional regulator [Amycolatopsis antarctica]|uniref:TetR family transcriptional regulator n=1 Tax=Amycolatopsis antarctica TaxID=1854586 RepID=A0A263D6V4_9PSEU|nr:TetR/AcrR family transcriptional regulator [Amycolatopsis antarctica]OZM73307.1 TetR family transcriptional regulator [Amycolatopsis antarctica]